MYLIGNLWCELQLIWNNPGELVRIGTAITGTMAMAAFIVACTSLWVQRGLAQKKAAIDFFLKTEMDHEMLKAHRAYEDAVKLLQSAPDIKAFAASDDCKPIRAYLNVHELLAVGVHKKVFHNKVSRGYWIAELERARTKCNRLIRHLKEDPDEKVTYVELVKLNSKWQRGW